MWEFLLEMIIQNYRVIYWTRSLNFSALFLGLWFCLLRSWLLSGFLLLGGLGLRHKFFQLIIEFLLLGLLKYFGVSSMLGLKLHELLIEDLLGLLLVLGQTITASAVFAAAAATTPEALATSGSPWWLSALVITNFPFAFTDLASAPIFTL